MSSSETKEAVAQCVAALDEHTYEFKVKDFIYLAETLIGADDTLAPRRCGRQTRDDRRREPRLGRVRT